MTNHPGRLLAGALLTLAIAAPAASATEVTVRIAGETDAARLGPVTVDTAAGGTFGPDSCPNDSAGGAIDLAVEQNWDRRSFAQTILGETHDFSRNDTWAFWLNDAYGQTGICDYVPKAGDEILMIADVSSPAYAPTVFPLSFKDVPASAKAGEPFTVTVVRHSSDGMTTTTAPLAGATVTAGGAKATTDAAGRATLTVERAGRVTLVATSPGTVSTDPVRLPVAAAEDVVSPKVTIAGIAKGDRFTVAGAPRRVHGRVRDASAIRRVHVSVIRRTAGGCARLTKRGTFRASSCKRTGIFFTAAKRGRWSAKLPKPLLPAAYTLRVVAVDAAGNRSRSRLVTFRVVR